MTERSHNNVFVVSALAVTAFLFGAAIALTGCTKEKQQAMGLGILNAVVELRNTAVKTVKTVDLAKQAELSKKYDVIQSSQVSNPDREEATLLKIDAERVQNDKNVSAAYDFLEAIGRICETAKVGLKNGADLALILPPVLAGAIDVERGLRALGINLDFVKLISGGK